MDEVGHRSWYLTRGKRWIDIALAAASLPLQAAVFAVVAPLIKFEDGGSVFHVAPRRGRHGEIFMMYKYRSMVMDAPDLRDAQMSTLNSADDWRQTRIGRVLRKTSLDELPQAINVLRGEMSVVGPRPNMTSRPLEALNAQELKRLQVRPGMTGWSQALHRNSATLETTLERDCAYVDQVSLMLDLRIVARTAATVLLRRNVYRAS